MLSPVRVCRLVISYIPDRMVENLEEYPVAVSLFLWRCYCVISSLLNTILELQCRTNTHAARHFKSTIVPERACSEFTIDTLVGQVGGPQA